jgi:polysaccharide export outer membrane protein
MDSITSEKITNYSPITIQPGDMLRLHVASQNSDADQIFNYNVERPNILTNMPDVRTSPESRSEPNSIVSYIIDKEGYMHIPMIGKVKVGGLTTDMAATTVEELLKSVLTQPVVSITIQNLKISVLGDVGRPGTYNIQDERMTINEALAYAGDLAGTGIRNNILIIREVDGTRQYVPIDLTSKKTFSSPYYYLKNNDIIYVKPNRQKIIASDASIQTVALMISALSVLALFITRK